MNAAVLPPRRAVRRRFGLETILPADPAVVEAQILRMLAARTPDLVIVRPSSEPDRSHPPGHRPAPRLPKGVPDLLLLGATGRAACLKIKTQADRLSREQAGFAALCDRQRIPYAVVRSVAEAEAALARFGFRATEVRP